MRCVKNQTRIRRGAAAVELALWLPFLAVMFVVAVDFCRVYYATQVVQDCARAGAMYASGIASANPDDASGVDPAVQAAIADGVSLKPPLEAKDVTLSYPSGMSQVSVSYDFAPLVRWPGIGSAVTITRTVTMAKLPVPGI